MEVKILFYKSSSKFYDSVCSSCEIFSGYTPETSRNTLVVDLEELKEKQNSFKMIMSYLKNWTKTEYFINDVPASLCL